MCYIFYTIVLSLLGCSLEADISATDRNVGRYQFFLDDFIKGVYWREYIPNQIPDDAIEALPGKYIGQFVYKDNLLVGTLYPYSNTVVGEHYGQKNAKRNIKILCTSCDRNVYWERVDFGKPMDKYMIDAIKGGYGEDVESDLFIGRSLNTNDGKIGKVVEALHAGRGLWIWDSNGNTSRKYEFEILKYNSTFTC